MHTRSDADAEQAGRGAIESLLSSFAPLHDAERTALRAGLGGTRAYDSDEEIGPAAVGDRATTVLLSGWGGWVKSYPDGRRQIVALLLPGDVIPAASMRDPALASLAFTPVETADATALIARLEATPGDLPNLAQAWRLAQAAAEARLVAQVSRIGRLSAYERMADLLLELLERQRRVGLARGREIRLPLTQQILADVLGLSTVHVNRTLQAMRREQLVQQRGANALVLDEESLAQVAFRA